MPLELYNRSYRGVNPQTPKRKKLLTICSPVLSCCRLWSPKEEPFKNTFSEKNQTLFSTGGLYLVELSKKKACHIYDMDLAKKQLKKCNKFKAKITATQESFQRSRKEVHWRLVICPRISSKESLEKMVYEDLLCARWFFFHKEAYNSIAVRIFYYYFLRTFDFKMITLGKIS